MSNREQGCIVADEKVISRIKKLLALAKDCSSPEEAALAAIRAQELMLRHSINHSDLEQLDEAEIRDRGEIFPFGEISPWQEVLAYGCAEGAGASAFTVMRSDKLKSVHLVGTEADFVAVRTLYDYLAQEIARLTDFAQDPFSFLGDFDFAPVSMFVTWPRAPKAPEEAAREEAARAARKVRRVEADRKYKENFAIGAAIGVCDRLRARKEEIVREEGAKALILVSRKGRADDWMQKRFGDKLETNEGPVDPNKIDEAAAQAMAEGHRASRRVGLPSSAKRLKGEGGA